MLTTVDWGCERMRGREVLPALVLCAVKVVVAAATTAAVAGVTIVAWYGHPSICPWCPVCSPSSATLLSAGYACSGKDS